MPILLRPIGRRRAGGRRGGRRTSRLVLVKRNAGIDNTPCFQLVFFIQNSCFFEGVSSFFVIDNSPRTFSGGKRNTSQYKKKDFLCLSVERATAGDSRSTFLREKFEWGAPVVISMDHLCPHISPHLKANLTSGSQLCLNIV